MVSRGQKAGLTIERITPITSREQVAPELRDRVDVVTGMLGRGGQPAGRIVGTYSVLLHNPEMAARTAEIGACIRFESRLPPALRELATLVQAREQACELTWAGHAPQALSAGVRPEAIRAVLDGAGPEAFQPDEAPVVAYVRELIRRKRVAPGTYAAAQALLGDTLLVELTAIVGYYNMLACVLNAYQVEPPDVRSVHGDAGDLARLRPEPR